jgi:hypothetical protein
VEGKGEFQVSVFKFQVFSVQLSIISFLLG